MIAEHMPMARRIALRLARKVPQWIGKDDLVATAMLGLIEAVDRFDPGRGEPFIAFAEQRIRGAVLDELRRGDILTRSARGTQRKIGETIRRLEMTHQRPPTDEEIALALGVSVEEYREELEILTHVSFVELDLQEIERKQGGEQASNPLGLVERKQLADTVRAGIEALPERDATLLSLYYVEELTYAEIGTVLRVSESRVCQLHGRALARLRAEIDSATNGEVQ
jgi:RNA polymerase sigma factor for flagellar operon FliA